MAIIVGLEGVLARHEWRNELIQSEGWDAYHQAAENDAPNHPVIQAVNALHDKGQTVFCVCTRPDKWRLLTLNWMVRHGVKVDTLLMRPEDNWDKDEQLREAALETIVSKNGDDVMFAIEENEKACEFYRAAGIPVLQLYNPNGGT